jgi:DNA topoisomerase-1
MRNDADTFAPPPEPIAEAIAHAREAGLRYVSDRDPGIRRVRNEAGFRYLDPDGAEITDDAELARIRKLAIPPAYEDVWICANPRGHLLATGHDARGRKQYRYHPEWRAARDGAKFERMVEFGEALPRLRRRLRRDLALPGLPQDKVLAVVVALLDSTLVRIGNVEYARDNNSFGLTTLRDRHVKFIRDGRAVLKFKGKGGQEHEFTINDRRLARIVRSCQQLPGQHLFQYIGDDGAHYQIDSEQVNQYLATAMGADFTAKDFRTWGATVLAADALREVVRFESDTEAKHNVVAAIDSVARRLGHTRAVCRRSYVHPAVIDTYMDGSLEGVLKLVDGRTHRNLKAEEAAVIALLKRNVSRT